MIALEDRYCPLCGDGQAKQVKFPPTFSTDDLNAGIFSARRSPDRRHFRLVECTGCQIIFSDPACDASTLASLYEDSAVKYDRLEEQIYASYAPVLDRALPLLHRRGTFVELGGGSGFMLRYGERHGFDELIEVEPSADAEKRFSPPTPRSRFIRSVFTQQSLPSRSASLICFFQMLDHVPQPLGFLESVYRALEPGGVAVCVTHNTDAISASLLGERSPIYDIEHTYLFNPGNLSGLFRRAGLTDTEAFPISNSYSMRYWLHLAPLPPPLKQGVGQLLERSRVADVKLPLRAGNFAVIGRKPGGGDA